MSAHSHRPKATEQTAKPTQEAPFFQAKLTVNTPGDAYEQEADAVADQVMRMQEGDAPIVQRMPLTSVGDVQRKCAACEQEEEQQAQRKETGGGDASGKAAPGIVSDVLSSGAGRPMEGGTRQFMESRFGQDFGQVRVHTDSRAAESASAIQARAYTSGRDIVFGAGQYQPESEGGKRLLAHELAHVGQQGGGVKRAIGDGHDLESARFFGDDNLENSYDSEVYVKLGSTGESVLRVQKALIDLGYELPKFGVDGRFGQETKSAVKKFQKDNNLIDDGIVGPNTMAILDEKFRTNSGTKTVSYKVEEYIKLWEIRNGRKMTPEEKDTLTRGCIGVTVINLGSNGLPNPPLDQCYSTFDQARHIAQAMNEAIRHSGVNGRKAVIFSKRFWSGGDPSSFQPDAVGHVDRAGYNYEGRPDPNDPTSRMINFDYGLYDEKTGKWWHANHAEPGMNVYESTLEYYSRPLLNFDRQIFCVAVSNL